MLRYLPQTRHITSCQLYSPWHQTEQRSSSSFIPYFIYAMKSQKSLGLRLAALLELYL